MPIIIRLATPEDLQQYCDLLQHTYEETYTNNELGLSKERFSKEVFSSKNTQNYLKSKLEISNTFQTWLAFDNKKLVGSISIFDNGKECDLSGFYVDPKSQGKGIGKSLFELVLKFSGTKNIILDTYTHNIKTIEIYKKWGFIINKEKGRFYRHWPEWPENLKAECLYMIRHHK